MKSHVTLLASALALIMGTTLAPAIAQVRHLHASAPHAALSLQAAPRTYTAMTAPDRDPGSIAAVPGTQLYAGDRLSGTLHLFGARTDNSPY